MAVIHIATGSASTNSRTLARELGKADHKVFLLPSDNPLDMDQDGQFPRAVGLVIINALSATNEETLYTARLLGEGSVPYMVVLKNGGLNNVDLQIGLIGLPGKYLCCMPIDAMNEKATAMIAAAATRFLEGTEEPRMWLSDEIYLDKATQYIVNKSDETQRQHLTASETTIITKLVEEKGLPVEKETLANIKAEQQASDNPDAKKSIDVQVCKLRKKIKAVGGDGDAIIETVWGKGYRHGRPEPTAQQDPAKLAVA